MTRWALLTIAAVVAGCVHRPIPTNTDVRCADAHPGSAVQVTTDPDGGESSSLVVRVLENNAPLEPGSIRIFPRDVIGELRRPKPESLGRYEYRGLRPGWYLVEVRKIGYDQIVDSLELRPETRHSMWVTLRPKDSCLI
jgi:hypothetical protein